MNQSEIREKVTSEIVEALQQGLTPWRMPWAALINTGFPANVSSKRHYQGINPILLQLAAHKNGFQSQWWGTYRQWQALGGQVKKRPSEVAPGKWGTKIVFYKPIKTTRLSENGDEQTATFPLLREFVVFNADQVEGVEKYQANAPATTSAINYEPAEKVIAATGADIRHVAGDQAAYHRLPEDFIVVPLQLQFELGAGKMAGYYDTIMHELAHWSEHRLGWTGSYALGELRAELGATYLTAAVEIPQLDASQVANNAKYLDSWIKAMKEDHKVVFRIAAAASKAADFILSFSRDEAEVAEEVAAA